jgi:GT2 family glycosyltransferase
VSAPPSAAPRNREARVAEITAIVVSWRDADDLEAAVASLAAASRNRARTDVRTSLIAVGNGGGPASVSPSRIEELWPGATVIVNEENRGLGPAANQGASAASGDVLLFLNPDTRAVGDPFSALAAGFESRPEAAALAPRLVDTNDENDAVGDRRLAPPGTEDQFTFQLRKLPRLSSDLRELLLLEHIWPNGPSRRRARYADRDRGEPFPVEQAAAAAFAVRADVFARIGGFDETFVPAWFEDVDLCARLASEGGILFWPAARFRHAGGVSSARLGYDRFLPILYANALRYRRKHYGTAARRAYRALLVPGMLLRLLALPLRRSVPRPRREAARAYLAVLRLALRGRP